MHHSHDHKLENICIDPICSKSRRKLSGIHNLYDGGNLRGGKLDIQKALENMPGFIWSKYPGEKHLPGHNFTGPGTRLDLRLNPDDSPKTKPINRVDVAALKHDIFYRENLDTNKRHVADQRMIQELEHIQDPTFREKVERAFVNRALRAKIKLGVGLPERKSKQEANQILKDINKKETVPKVVEKSGKREKEAKAKPVPADKKQLSQEERDKLADELHFTFRKPNNLLKVKVHDKDNIWSADLVEMREENKYRYILTVIDLYTKYAWAIPLSDKKGLTVAEAFKNIMNESKRKPKKLWVDKGKEFYNQYVKALPFEIYSTSNDGKAVVVERVNRTLKQMMFKKFTSQGNQKWLKILPEIVNTYNNKVHSTIKTTPKYASENPNSIRGIILKNNFENEMTLKRKKPKFKVNQRVRIFKWKSKFEKGYTAKWNEEVFIVRKINSTAPITYELEDEEGEEIVGRFYENELQPTDF